MSDNWVVSTLENALSNWNDHLAEIWSLVSQTPESFRGGEIWTVIVSIHNALVGFGYGLLVLFFAMGVFRSAASFRELQRPEFALRHFIRFLLAKVTVGSSLELINGIYKICGGVVSTVMGGIGSAISTTATLPDKIVEAIEDVSFLESIPLWLVSLLGSLLITVLLVLLVEVMFLYSATRSYYNGVQQTMYRRFSSITGQLKMYTGETSQKTAASRSVALRRMVEQFSDKDKYEFMLLDSYGGVIASSSGTDAEGIVTHTDFEQAQDAVDGQGIAIYRTQSGEMVMAACCLVPYAAEDVAAMRLVTSLTLVEEQLKRTVVVALIMGAAVLAFTIMSGLYFVRSIVVPLGQVERTAAGIALGELDVRLPVTGDERDEVDRLRGTINRMAEGLEETEKMKNEFISSVSHELRTPLTSIRGWVETLRTLDDPSDENYRKGLEIINNETARLYNMVEELLDFSRLQNGRLKMTCRPLDLVAELTDAVLFCEARIQREGLVLVYNEPEEMIPVYADPDRLRQVFINILDNAIKYSAPGGRITVKLWAGEYKAFIELIDQGRGIPPEDLENVKTKFYKGSNSVRGSGIGLALVDSIMTALDGTMDIKSTLGRGTVVTLGLPLYKK